MNDEFVQYVFTRGLNYLKLNHIKLLTWKRIQYQNAAHVFNNYSVLPLFRRNIKIDVLLKPLTILLQKRAVYVGMINMTTFFVDKLYAFNLILCSMS